MEKSNDDPENQGQKRNNSDKGHKEATNLVCQLLNRGLKDRVKGIKTLIFTILLKREIELES